MNPAANPRPLDFARLAVLYFVGAKIGVTLTVMPEGMAILWPPNAVLLTFLIRFGTRRLPVFVLLTLATEVAADMPTFQVHEALLFGLNNIMEVVLAYVLLSRWDFNPRFESVADLAKFAAAAPFAAAFAAASTGALIYTTFRGGTTNYLEFLRIWWFGDGLGLLILTPLMLMVWGDLREPHLPLSAQVSDALLALAALGTIALLLMSGDGTLSGVHVGPVLLLPFTIYAAARFGVHGAALAVGVAALVILFLATHGYNPFGRLESRETVIRAQELIFVTSLTAIGFALLLSQVRAHRARLELANAEVRALNTTLEDRVRERTRELEQAVSQVNRLQGLLPICAWCKRVRDDEDYWHSVEDYISRRTEARFSHGICPDCLRDAVRSPQPE